MEDAPGKDCAVIELRSGDSVKLAKVLRKAWMEGGMKRGLQGAVVVPDDAVRAGRESNQLQLQ
eukprot:7390851-Prymnesium_polylepis.2